MAKKKGFFNSIGSGIKKFADGTLKIVDKIVHVFSKNVEESGIAETVANGTLGLSTNIGTNTGTNIYYQPPNNPNTISYGKDKNTGNNSFFINDQVVNPRKSVEERISTRDALLREYYGPGYIPESSLATMGAVAIGNASKQFANDTINVANLAGDVLLNNWVSIYSYNDSKRQEAFGRNVEIATNANQAISKVVSNPAIISNYYENRAINATTSFADSYKQGNLFGAGKSSGQMLYDVGTITTIASGATNFAVKNVPTVLKETNKFIANSAFRPPLTFQFSNARASCGIPVDVVKIPNNLSNIIPRNINDCNSFKGTQKKQQEL